MKKTIVIGVVFCLFFYMQSTVIAADLGIRHVSLAKIFDKYQKVVDSNSKIEEQKKKLKDLIDEIKELDKNFDQLSEEGKEERKKEIQAKQERLRQQTLDIRKDEERILKEILQDIERVADEIRKSKKITYIIDDRLVISGVKEMDITDDVIKMLNERYKGK